MTRRTLVLALALLALPSCAGALQALQAMSTAGRWVSTLVSVAEAGAEAYYARHPSQSAEATVAAAVKRARLALAALDAALVASESVADAGVVGARADVLRAYEALRRLLLEGGVLQALAPAGGAETDAPEPVPFALPTVGEVESRL